MGFPTPNNWRSAVVDMAISILAAAVALRIAAALVRGIGSELIGCAVVLAVVYLFIRIEHFRRSRW